MVRRGYIVGGLHGEGTTWWTNYMVKEQHGEGTKW